MLEENINISQFRRGAEAIVNQLNEICGGNNPVIKLNFSDQSKEPRNTPNTLSSILQEYGDSVHNGEGIGYIGLEWKGPFPLHSSIIQHIKRIQLLVGRPPSLTYGFLPHINYGYVGLENILYIFSIGDLFENGAESTSGYISETSNDSYCKRVNNGLIDNTILTLSLPFPVKMVTGSFPRANIFSKDVEYILCVITEKSGNLLALKLDKCNSYNLRRLKKWNLPQDGEEINEYGVDYNSVLNSEGSVVKGAGLINVSIMKINGKEINMFQCSLPNMYASKLHSLQGTLDGRFFFFEEESSNIYEFVYHSKEGWITPYCYIHSHKVNYTLSNSFLFKYTFLRIFQRTFISKVSVAPCGYMAILDSSQNIHIAKYLNDSDSSTILPLIAPWGRIVNSIESWVSNVNLKPHLLPSDWDDYVCTDENNYNVNNNYDLTDEIDSCMSQTCQKNYQGRFSSPSSIKIIYTFKRTELNKILSQLSGKFLNNEGKNEDFRNFVVEDICLSFTFEYNLTISLFMENGSILQFQCSKRNSEYIPPLSSISSNCSGVENHSMRSPLKKLHISEINNIFELKPGTFSNNCDVTVFGFWLTNFIPHSVSIGEESRMTNSFCRNGLTIITRSTTCKTVKNVNANTDFSKTPSRNICKVELRLFNSLPADINLDSNKFIDNSLFGRNFSSPMSSSLRYNNNTSFSSNLKNNGGEPIFFELDEQIKSIYEVKINSDNSIGTLEEFPILNNSKSLIYPDVNLEYGGNQFGKKNNYDLLGWIHDRHIILVGETRYFLLTLRWNGVQHIIGASGLFMQIMRNSQMNSNVDNSNTNFRRLVHPEDSFLTSNYLSLTSPWIEALSGAIAFDLRCILELPLFYRSGQDLNFILTPHILELCFLRLQKVSKILSRSRNIIGNELFNFTSLPNNKLNQERSIHEIIIEELGTDCNIQLKRSTTFIIKSIAFIVNLLSQLIQFLMIFISSPENIRKITLMYLGRYENTNILTEMPLIFLLVSNKGICRIRFLVESFSMAVIGSTSHSRNYDSNLLNQLKCVHSKIGWILSDKANRIMKRLALFQDLSEDPDINSILKKITSRNKLIGSFTSPPYKYWESFLLDQTQSDFLKEIFSSLTLKPWNRIADSTLLLLQTISYFELFLTEQIESRQKIGYFETNKSNNINVDLNSFNTHIEGIIEAWTKSLSDSFYDLLSHERDKKKIIRNKCLSLFIQPIKTLLSYSSNTKLINMCLKYLLRDILALIIKEYYLSNGSNSFHCICQQLLKDFQVSLKFENGNSRDYNKPFLTLISDELNSILQYSNIRERCIYSKDQFISVLNDLITSGNYSPFYYVLSCIYLTGDDKSFGSIKSASVLSFIALDADICCGEECRNVRTRIDSLKMLRKVYFLGGRSVTQVEINVSNYFPHLFDEKITGKDKYQMDFSIENAISNADGLISSSNYLQIPLSSYLEKYLALNENGQLLKTVKTLSSRICSFSEIISIINTVPDLQPFSIISVLFNANKRKSGDDAELEEICSLISDLLLQTLFPPIGHTINRVNLNDDTNTPIFPLLSYFFGFNGYLNYHESIQKLFEFVQTPLLNISGSSLLGALSFVPNIFQCVGLSDQEIIKKYDLFQQLYSISAVLEFGNFYLIKNTKNLDIDCFIPTSVSLKLWNKYFSIPHDLIFDIYMSLLDSCSTSSLSSSPYSLIINRIADLESPINNFESLSLDNNSFTLHIRKCIIGVAQSWINNSVNQEIDSNYTSLIKDFMNASVPIIKKHDKQNEKRITNISEGILSKL
ncbi:hypothetical protein FG379_002529 [Cryptosporidium bovis]|uniref:uncharacterized protein n=1 Tax=Cryptosporidium bovis TaxID=310047 RepID=UPI00351A04EE|nr:hypothetical protein FG379_002529 [Cryptosporidium bovis]